MKKGIVCKRCSKKEIRTLDPESMLCSLCWVKVTQGQVKYKAC